MHGEARAWHRQCASRMHACQRLRHETTLHRERASGAGVFFHGRVADGCTMDGPMGIRLNGKRGSYGRRGEWDGDGTGFYQSHFLPSHLFFFLSKELANRSRDGGFHFLPLP